MAGKNKNTFFIKTFDILFVMILCFMTLLTTMILRGSVIVGSDSSSGIKYSFGIVSFLITFISFIAYLYYIISNSNRELGNMVNEIYKNDLDKK